MLIRMLKYKMLFFIIAHFPLRGQTEDSTKYPGIKQVVFVDFEVPVSVFIFFDMFLCA